MNHSEKISDKFCHDIAEIELCKIVYEISESYRKLGDAVRDLFTETTKAILSETPSDMSHGNEQLPPNGILPDSGMDFREVAENLTIYIANTGELRSMLTNSGLTLQERTVVVQHYIRWKPGYETGTMTEYENAEDILWNALVKIGDVVRHDEKQ